jgi:RAQPRD family integrative conjugative element protein
MPEVQAHAVTQPVPATVLATEQHDVQPRAHRAWLIAMLVACAALTQPARAADPDTERESLARITSELERVQVMVKDAADRAPSGQRVKFRYDWLLRDIQLMRDGLSEHVDAPRQPRPVPPLRGDYRQ